MKTFLVIFFLTYVVVFVILGIFAVNDRFWAQLGLIVFNGIFLIIGVAGCIIFSCLDDNAKPKVEPKIEQIKYYSRDYYLDTIIHNQDTTYILTKKWK